MVDEYSFAALACTEKYHNQVPTLWTCLEFWRGMNVAVMT